MKDAAQQRIIVDTALGKFRRFGIRRVSMDELARELRISKKTLYQHFDSKEALVRACIDVNVGYLLPRAAAALEGGGTAFERISRVWQVLSELPRLVTVELLGDLKADYPHLWEEIDQRRRLVIGRIEALIADGIAGGEINPEIHPKVMMRVVFAVLDQVLVPDVMALGEFAPAQAIDTVLTLLTRGLFVAPPARADAAPEKVNP